MGFAVYGWPVLGEARSNLLRVAVDSRTSVVYVTG